MFEASIDRPKVLNTLLNCIKLGKDQFANVIITKDGMKFSVEQSRIFQGNVFLQNEIFQNYKCLGEVSFNCNYSVLLEIVSISASSSSSSNSESKSKVSFLWKEKKTDLVITIEETENESHSSGVTKGILRTMGSEEPLDFQFASSRLISRFVMEAKYLRDAFGKLDWGNSNKTVCFLVSPNPPYFQVSSKQPEGCCKVDYPKHSREVFEDFVCSKTQEYHYQMCFLRSSIEALNVSRRIQVRINELGTLSLQHMIETHSKQLAFVDFYLLPSSSL